MLMAEGKSILDAHRNPVQLRGPTVASLNDMERAGVNIQTKIASLATAGARVLRLPVREGDMSPGFANQKLVPFVQAANAQGIYVIIALEFGLSAYDDTRFDAIENSLREQIPYFGSSPGVMFEPIREIKTMTPLRRKNVAQRMIDGLRGYRARNIYIATEPVYLSDLDASISVPLTGGNIVYGVHTASEVPADAIVPIALLSTTNVEPGIPIVLTDDDPVKYGSLWQTSTGCM